eukprot:GILJ01004325.1.p1 GENE.GILJ01004325.1~~GILJ01004325.1.p1  ORF type:complete len:319 (-),score=36.44 GILJ01004325.1:142-1098(-)
MDPSENADRAGRRAVLLRVVVIIIFLVMLRAQSQSFSDNRRAANKPAIRTPEFLRSLVSSNQTVFKVLYTEPDSSSSVYAFYNDTVVLTSSSSFSPSMWLTGHHIRGTSFISMPSGLANFDVHSSSRYVYGIQTHKANSTSPDICQLVSFIPPSTTLKTLSTLNCPTTSTTTCTNLYRPFAVDLAGNSFFTFSKSETFQLCFWNITTGAQLRCEPLDMELEYLHFDEVSDVLVGVYHDTDALTKQVSLQLLLINVRDATPIPQYKSVRAPLLNWWIFSQQNLVTRTSLLVFFSMQRDVPVTMALNPKTGNFLTAQQQR